MVKKEKNINPFLQGSKWRKWDLHIHTPASYDWDRSCKSNNQNIVETAIASDISAIAITDHHSVDSIDEIKKLGEDNGLFVIPGVEIRTDKGNKKIHIIGLFDPVIEAKTIYDKVLCPLGFTIDDIKKKGDEQIYCLFENACEKIHSIGGLVVLHAGSKSNGIEQLDSDLKSLLKTDIASQVDIFEVNSEKQAEEYWKIVFKNIKNYLPCIITSDSFERTTYKKGHSIEGIGKKFSWVKADLTLEGLKQIIYEPKLGERVWLRITLPDVKEDYKVIEKIVFENNNDFPSEVVFNHNLSSIIGSRSSGKSALLAYLADGVNQEKTREQLKDGPADGFYWKDVNFKYTVVWANKKTNEESQGNMVFISQNHLFEISKKSSEIKEKIQPVLFKNLPAFKAQYNQTESNVSQLNTKISNDIDTWFLLSDLSTAISDEIKDLGNKKSVQLEATSIQLKINQIKTKNQLSSDEIDKYSSIKADITAFETQVEQIKVSLTKIANVTKIKPYFTDLDLTTIPSSENLPIELREALAGKIRGKKSELLNTINETVLKYKNQLSEDEKTLMEKIGKIKKDNKELITKYQKNIELQDLVEKLNKQKETVKKIEQKEAEKENNEKKIQDVEVKIQSHIVNREKSIKELAEGLNPSKEVIENISFGIEYGIDDLLEEVSQKINTRGNTDFVRENIFDLGKARNKPKEFLSALYSGTQKIKSNNTKKGIAKEALTLTEKILFTAIMEEDKIGGFSESTMTPGKRALFALRLILAESDGLWPLLIDQPEDDLDSRSIYDEIVPFIKEKKKKRQIIMVSHNANMVIGSDSEQIIVANRDGVDRKNLDGKQFNYLTGSIENSKKKDVSCKDTLLSQGIREHSCDILDGGVTAFENRIKKYNIRLNKK